MGLMMYLTRLGTENIFRSLFAAYLAICLLFLAVPLVKAAADERHSLADVELAIKQFVNKQFANSLKVETVVNKFDPHLRLAKCNQPLEIFYPARARRMGPTTVGVQCMVGKSWKIFVPIQVKVFAPAVVSKQSLPRGSILTSEDLKLVKREVSSAMYGHFASIKQLEGMELRISMAQGQIIGPRAIKPRHLVKRGDIVTVIAESNGLHIRIKGKALMNGYHGQSIRVKNTRSDRVLQGEVVAVRTVRINL